MKRYESITKTLNRYFQIGYSYGQGETRIGKNREDGKITKESHEIIIVKDENNT